MTHVFFFFPTTSTLVPLTVSSLSHSLSSSHDDRVNETGLTQLKEQVRRWFCVSLLAQDINTEFVAAFGLVTVCV